jgi:signal transduction histidine kinase
VKANGEPTGQEFSLPLEVVRPLVLRLEFWLVLAAITGGGAAWLGRVALQRRMQRQIARMEQEHALERERTRIARDLHDDIGAGLTEIAMQSDWVRRDLLQGPTADTQRRIGRVCQAAVELVRSVDEIVWAVNPANDTVKRFVNYLVQSTEQTLDAAGLRVRFEVPPDLPDTPLAGTTRHYLFLAVREALNNAIRHAQAELVRLEVCLADAALQIAIADNGCGFDPAQAEADGTHEGLDNMRRRMAELGGHFELTSRPGSGTRVELRVPLA